MLPNYLNILELADYSRLVDFQRMLNCTPWSTLKCAPSDPEHNSVRTKKISTPSSAQYPIDRIVNQERLPAIWSLER